MRRRLVLAVVVALGAIASACNAVLGNELGHIDPVDAAAPMPDVAVADASDAAPLDAGWSIASFGSDLALWLDADRGLATVPCTNGRCAVSWGDQSGHGNGARSPNQLKAPRVRPAQFNGHTSLFFDADAVNEPALSIKDAPSLQAAAGFAIFGVVAQLPGSSHVVGIFTKSAVPLPFAGPALWLDFSFADVDASAGRAGAQVDFNQWIESKETRLDDNALRIYSVRFDDTTSLLTLRVNDGAPVSALVSVAAGSLRAVGQPVGIGGYDGNDQGFDGDIAEIIYVTRTIDDAEWTRTFGYLKTKYAL